MKKELFTLTRFQVLTAALTDGPRQRLSDDYVYAWYGLVYPICDQAADWHQPYPDEFKVTKDMIEEFTKLLDDSWSANDVPTFYKLEHIYRARGGSTQWGRSELLRACRYLKLNRSFDDQFWTKLLADRPSEAHGIELPFDRDKDLFFH